MRLHEVTLAVMLSVLALWSPRVSDAATRARTLAEPGLRDAAVQLAVGGSHVCQVNGDGTVRCWGNNGSGQIGDGTTTTRLTPVSVPAVSSIVAIAAGASHTCALFPGGTAVCWGDNARGQLGDGTTATRTSPVTVLGLAGAVALAAGANHTCALLADGTGRCWGDNGGGQLGDGTTATRTTPVPVIGLTDATALAAGLSHTCALVADGTARCWGNNGVGQLGDGSTASHVTPVAVVSLANASAITAGSLHTCALVADGTARCWGNSFFGQLGSGLTTSLPLTTPRVVTGLANAVSITAGAFHTCALLVGSARCWGDNTNGQLGDGTTTQRATPVSVKNLLNTPVGLAAGSTSACAVQSDGSVRCWGLNTSGQLGNGTTASSVQPVVVAGGGGSITARDLAAGGFHTCVVRANGTVSCWGDNNTAQIGDGTTTDRLTAVAVPGLSNVVSVAAGYQHSCALLATGSARCWGANFSGQLGNGTKSQSSPLVFVSGLANAVAIAAGVSHTCALLANGTVRCWGSNNFGQIGDGTTGGGGNLSRLTPVAVVGLTNAVAIAAGAAHTCALRADGTVRCWGSNGGGELGDGSTETRPIPAPVVGLTGAVALTAGIGSQTCALLAGGSARCWGLNFGGQVGDGTTVDRSLPTGVVGLASSVAISAGSLHTCALVSSSGARCWGTNEFGQLGDGTTTNRLTATVVTARLLSLTMSFGGATKVALGQDHSCVLQATGAVACWGNNGSGQLGIGTTVNRLQPAGSLPSFTFNIDPAMSVEGRTGVALVTVLAACDAGRHVDLAVRLTQGAAVGEGSGAGECTGGIARYPVAVVAQGSDAFADGPAVIEAEGRVQEGGVVVDTQDWTREVQIATAPVAASRLSGSAVGLGRGSGRGGVSVTERLTVTAPVDMASPVTAVTLTNLLNEIRGAGELVESIPLSLHLLPGNDAGRATFSTPDGARPSVSLSIRRRSGGVLDLVLDVVGATIDRPDGCSPTGLLTSVTINDGTNPPVVLPVVQAWNCATRGGVVEYLRAP